MSSLNLVQLSSIEEKGGSHDIFSTPNPWGRTPGDGTLKCLNVAVKLIKSPQIFLKTHNFFASLMSSTYFAQRAIKEADNIWEEKGLSFSQSG